MTAPEKNILKQMPDFKPTLLLHACCAPCSAYVIQELKDEFEITVFLYNPNIHPLEEYLKRTDELIKYLKKEKIDYIEAEYDIQNWLTRINGLENEPEKGKRCNVCFYMRLEKTASFAQDNHFDFFASTLSLSPHKDSKLINNIGYDLEYDYGVRFLDRDFKENDGFKKSCEISRENNFYRQNYCGCIFSKKQRENRKT